MCKVLKLWGHQIVLLYKISSIYISYKMFERLPIYQIYITYENILNKSDLLTWIVVNWQYLSWNVMSSNELSLIVKKNMNWQDMSWHVLNCCESIWILIVNFFSIHHEASWIVMNFYVQSIIVINGHESHMVHVYLNV